VSAGPAIANRCGTGLNEAGYNQPRPAVADRRYTRAGAKKKAPR
jgi:hypothetical protein